MRAIDLTRDGLLRALGAAVAGRPALDRAVRARADAVAAGLADSGAEARVARRGHGDYAVESRNPGSAARRVMPRSALDDIV